MHWLAHLLGTNEGRVYTFWDGETMELRIGFKCDKCGSIEGIKESRLTVLSMPTASRYVPELNK